MKRCIVCASSGVELFLDLGETALANRFPRSGETENEVTHPLRVGFCGECSHVQLMDEVPPREMFDSYLYVSSASDTLRGHLHGLARTILERCELEPGELVLDVGCNDGTLLEGFGNAGHRTSLGVDPAMNLSSLAGEKGVRVMTAYFGPESARAILSRFGPVSVMTMTNTFPHIPDLDGLIDGLDTVLKQEGSFVIETHYLGDMVEGLAFDTIYHEHVSYWALGPMVRLFRAHDFEVVDVERLPIHHGQLRAWIQRKGVCQPSERVEDLLSKERDSGLDDIEIHRTFAKRTFAMREKIREKLSDIRASGCTVAGYGAPAKGNTLLGFLGLGPAELPFIADRSPLKQGRVTPGCHIPVVSPERILEDQPDYLILLAWNFADEIIAQQGEYIRRGGRFLIPLPELQVVG